MVVNFVGHSAFRIMIGIVIIINFVFICVEADFRASGEALPMWMVTCSYVTMIVYCIETLLKLYGFQKEFASSSMNVFDAVIVFVDVLLFVVAFYSKDDLPSLAVLRAVRVLRIVRILNSILIFRELYLMMQGLMSALRSIAFGTSLIFMVLTTWSILSVEFLHPRVIELDDAGVFGDCSARNCRLAFRSVLAANLTFMKTVIAGDGWGQLAVPLIEIFPASAFILIPAVISVQLGLVNVIAAVIVDRQTQARVEDESLTHAVRKEELHRSYRQLQSLFVKMDDDRGGSLSLDEILVSYDEVSEFRDMMDLLDIQRHDLPLVFKILDTDSSGDVSYTEFVEKLHYIRFLNEHTLLVFIKQHCENLSCVSLKALEQLAILVEATREEKLKFQGIVEAAEVILTKTQEYDQRLTNLISGDSSEPNRVDSFPSKLQCDQRSRECATHELNGVDNGTDPSHVPCHEKDNETNSSHVLRPLAAERKAVQSPPCAAFPTFLPPTRPQSTMDLADGRAFQQSIAQQIASAVLDGLLEAVKDVASGKNCQHSSLPASRWRSNTEGPSFLSCASAHCNKPTRAPSQVSAATQYMQGDTAIPHEEAPGLAASRLASPRDDTRLVDGPVAFQRAGTTMPHCTTLWPKHLSSAA
eukprot:TRINITY_DN10396_c0_g2_i1.p1 TRINITY_DN10396_c0_g2~~TRINITY_DN10396_c0_g2_i1.p1  ORF type:complete len:733 (-),score=76.41 TRINITY_DN10396_c0_g2_i1:335-2260(-)